MAALDTNVWVRFLVQDDAAQGAAATRLIRAGVESGSALFVPVTVMLELEWVLRTAFGFEKTAVILALFGLLGSYELAFESEAAVELALAQFEQTSADFADCLHVALAGQAGLQPMWTFDMAAAQLDGAALLELSVGG